MAANGGSIPATPEMLAAQPNTRQWVRAWVASFEGEIEEQAEELTDKLVAKGFHSRRSLRGMRGRSEEDLAGLLGVPYGVASEFKAEAEAIHGNAAGGGAQQMMQMLSGGGGGVVSTGPRIWKEFSCKLREGGSQLLESLDI